ncbi:endonuclease/exonuclease/phosphatase family protein [Nitratireductor basaltis]|uniref:Endonuclease/exonuclease/phosphatase n=1 Tax=Nitratireductor basaltis TaxID=472175 RepID=A0A084UEN6_9HYPH|nr:endonuclease/exonuclease/phosphatase family protein [Nitratireductor basaltis]KFB11422.1 Endonuclease/exonuclease/phosphatase precursor [Nitratireductor basaltis]
MLRTFFSGLLATIIVVLTGASLISLVDTNVWWVRMADFPRLHYLVLLLVLLIAFAMTLRGRRKVLAVIALFAAAGMSYNFYKLYPYIHVADREAETCAPDQRFSILVANVKLENRNADRLLTLVRDEEPDIFLALETNEWWDEQLAPLAESFGNTAQKITGSYFGMHLFSRFALENTRIINPVAQDTPAIETELLLESGERIRFLGLHPRPPHPNQRSIGRDAQLMWAALKAREADLPVVLAGDLNAVPWEKTVERLQRVGRFMDPRQRFGYMATYDANSWWMRWPLDQVLHQGALATLSYEVLPSFGSDHYPIKITLCASPSDQEPPPMEEDDLQRARRDIDLAQEG